MTEEPNRVRLITIFVSSPADVPEERKAMDEIVERINQSDGKTCSYRVETFRWEKNVFPVIGRGPQEEVNAQTPKYDIYFGILNMRFGTPTQLYGSGTEEEFRTAMEGYRRRKKPWIVVYFKKPSVFDPEASDAQDRMSQYARVKEFRKELEQIGIVGHFTEVRESGTGFVEQVEIHLRRILSEFLAAESRESTQEAASRLRTTVTTAETAPSASVVTEVIRDTRRPILDFIGPTYVLDKDYFFLDWNSAFDLIVAKPLGLARTDHAVDFISKLENCSEVVTRSETVFARGKDPLSDTEVLRFRSPDYGLIEFRKIAALISDGEGAPLAWSVSLNITRAEKEESLWHDLEGKLREVANWSRYAVYYDKLLQPFDDYQQLLTLIVDLVDSAEFCVDLGAGTGNGTLKLLEDDRCPDREVWAVESNEDMLEQLRAKTKKHSERLITVKDDIIRLGALRDQQEYFDAAVMTNVLYAVHNPKDCLRRVYNLLKPGGSLILSTPHRDTDVDKLFRKMHQVLEKKPGGLFNTLAGYFDAAKKVHRAMEQLIHRDTKEDIRGHLIGAGFEIHEDDWHDAEYVDAVIVVRAVKPEF